MLFCPRVCWLFHRTGQLGMGPRISPGPGGSLWVSESAIGVDFFPQALVKSSVDVVIARVSEVGCGDVIAQRVGAVGSRILASLIVAGSRQRSPARVAQNMVGVAGVAALRAFALSSEELEKEIVVVGHVFRSFRVCDAVPNAADLSRQTWLQLSRSFVVS